MIRKSSDGRREIVRSINGTPHGGHLETLAKLAFAVMLVVNLLSWMNQRSKHEVVATQHGDIAALHKAEAAFQTFQSKGNAWTIDDLVNVRNTLVTIRDAEGHSQSVSTRIDALVQASVGKTLDALNSAAAASITVKERIVTQGRVERVRSELFSHPPFQPVFAGGFGHILWALAKLGGKTYLLFMSFALLCFLARVSRNRLSLSDELMFGFRRLAVSTVFWPAGMSEYPRDTAFVLRRQKIAKEYLVRHGRSVWDSLTEMDQRAIDRLVMQPLTELRQSLDAIRELPFRLVLKARLAFCVSVFASYMLTVTTFGRSTAHAAENTAVTDVAAQVTTPSQDAPEVPQPLSLSGFTQVSANMENGNTKAERMFIRGVSGPFKGLTVNLMGNVVNPALLIAQAVYRRGSISVGAGQIVYPSALQVPSPDGQRIIGGPLCQSLIPFWGLGAEVLGDHGVVKWGLAYLSETDLGAPGVRKPRSAQAALSLPKLGPFGLLVTATVGKDDAGIHAYYSAMANLHLGPVDVVGNGVLNKDAGVFSKGVTGFLGWHFTPHLDVTGQFDRLEVPNAPVNQRFGLQITALGWTDRLRLGILGFRSSVAGLGSLMRLQFAF